MFIKNDKPVRIIGFPESSIAEQYCQVFSREGFNDFQIITPENFKSLIDKDDYQYIIAFYLDMKLREEICNLLDNLNLDCVTYVGDLVYRFSSSKIGKGCFIADKSILCWNCSVGDHCYLDMGAGIGHDVIVGRNSIVSSRVDIAGRTKIGENCKFFFNCTVLNNLTVCDDVTLHAHSNIMKDIKIPGKYVGRNARLMRSENTDKDL